jgi:putative heme degradation protein
MDDNVNSGQNMDLQGDNDNDIYIIDSSDMTEYDKMIENMKKELLWCKLKLNYLENIVSVMLEESYHS